MRRSVRIGKAEQSAGQSPSVEYAWGYSAEHDGTTITGGRGKDPIYVTNLNNGGTGSFGEALGTNTGGPILFESGGSINCESDPVRHVIDGAGDITVWGNTAPSGNISLEGRGAIVDVNKANVIIRHLAVHLTDTGTTPSLNSRDCIRIVYNAGNGRTPQNILIENCTMSGSTDELWSVTSTDGSSLDNFNFYRCLAGYPIADAGRGEIHNFGPLFNYHNRAAMIESAVAHVNGRPKFLPNQHSSAISNLYYMWCGSGWNVDQLRNNNFRFWFEGNRISCHFIMSDILISYEQYLINFAPKN